MSVPIFVYLLAALALVFLLWVRRLLRALEQTREENLYLRQILQQGSHDAQQDLETLRRLRHDLRHYLRMAEAAALTEKDIAALNRTLDAPLASGRTRSWALGILEHYYRSRGEALGFRTDIHLNLTQPREDLLPDLCLIVSNLLENAVEALQREGGGWLRARSVSAPGYVSLVVGNSCTRPLRVHNGSCLSSKALGRLGIGLATVQEVAKRYGGQAEFSAENGEFRASVFLPCTAAPAQAAGEFLLSHHTAGPSA